MNLLLALLFVAALLAAWLAVQSLWLRLEGTTGGSADALAGRLGCGRTCGCDDESCRREGARTDDPLRALPPADDDPRP